MSEFFVDTSALAKRYINEIGSTWVKSWILPRRGNVTVISALSTVELVSLLTRQEREGKISRSNRVRIENNFLRHADTQYLVIELENDLLSIARKMLANYPLRALDAIQLASALQAQQFLQVTLTFVSADLRLLAAASAEGLATDDPNAHP